MAAPRVALLQLLRGDAHPVSRHLLCPLWRLSDGVPLAGAVVMRGGSLLMTTAR